VPQRFDGLGISLLYPDGWKIDVNELSEAEDTVSFESPCGAFISITRHDPQSVEVALTDAQNVMDTEYDEVETDSFAKRIANQELDVIEQRFVYLDFIIVSQLMCFQQSGSAYLVQIQGEDRDIDQLQLVFDAMLTSIFQQSKAEIR
jgi:hypothetical protein